MPPALPGHRGTPVLDPFMRFLRSAALVAATLPGCVCELAAQPASTAPTVTDVVEFTRIVFPREANEDELRAQISPDGTRAFVVTRTANTRTDRNRYRFLLLDVRPDRLEGGRVGAPEVLLALEPTLDNNASYPSVMDPRWVGDGTIVFRARLDGGVYQAYKVDTRTRRLVQLTHSPTDVVAFSVSDDLRQIAYTAQQPNPPLPPGHRSIVVANQSFWSVKFGQNDMTSQARRYQFFAAESGSRRPARKLGPEFAERGSMTPAISISPDGRWALASRYEPERHADWIKTYPLVAEATTRIGSAVSADPLNYFVRPFSYVPRRIVAYRLHDGLEQVALDAPDDVLGGATQSRPDRIWQASGRSVVIAGTHLPRPGPELAPPSDASHIVEYWPDTGRWEVIAALKGRLEAAYRLATGQDAFVAIDGAVRRHFERGAGGSWQEVDADAAASAGPLRRWTLRVRQALNQPPDIVAEGPGGKTVQLTTLNPRYSAAWGTMRPYEWKDAKGRVWNGGLLVPEGFDPGARHALVIQTYGFLPTRFYLDGSNIADGFTSGFAGRAFLRENILVLAFPVRASTGAPSGEGAAMAAFMDGVRGAIDALVGEGLVDPERIGIMGWSSTGERVLNQVTFSDAPIRAATVLDGDANTVFSLTVTYGSSDSTQVRKARTNGGLPFGPTLQNWVRNDPALNTDCVKAALRIESYGPWVLNNWDIYALLRRQYKPVEMVLIPGGTHGLLTPSERMISLQGNVDWFRFWLKGEERSAPFLWAESDETLKEQYRRWHQMAELKRIDDARPACAQRAEGR
jgi:dipeptidyl aminopeptidase/acylaminoacyl peptidase